MELTFEHRWRTATGALVFRLGGQLLYRLEAPGVVPSGFGEVREVFTDPKFFSPFLKPLEVCVEPSGARIQIANLVLRLAPEIDVPQLTVTEAVGSGQPIQFTWTSRVGQIYQLQVRSSLVGGSWQPVGSPLLGTGGTLKASAPPPASSGQLYYRLLASPSS